MLFHTTVPSLFSCLSVIPIGFFLFPIVHLNSGKVPLEEETEHVKGYCPLSFIPGDRGPKTEADVVHSGILITFKRVEKTLLHL